MGNTIHCLAKGVSVVTERLLYICKLLKNQSVTDTLKCYVSCSNTQSCLFSQCPVLSRGLCTVLIHTLLDPLSHSKAPPAPLPLPTTPNPAVLPDGPFPQRHLKPSPPPAALPSDPVPGIDSTSFWKSCNAARCTQAIFADFIDEINNISSRIQSDQASQEGEGGDSAHTSYFNSISLSALEYKALTPSTDYDVAIRVMEASGKLAEHVTKQQKGDVNSSINSGKNFVVTSFTHCDKSNCSNKHICNSAILKYTLITEFGRGGWQWALS